MDLRLISAILIGKTIGFLTKLSGGGATAAPGLYALKIDPRLVKKISKKMPVGSIIICGTNGKTTTSRLVSDILSTKYKIVHNRQGSNLLRGIASTLITNTPLFGKIKQELALWEVDEAALPQVIVNTYPKIIVLLNLFRDQLDRYGEVDTTREKWQKSLTALPKETVLIANADDPQISHIAQNFKGRVIFFGVNEQKLNLPEIAHVADIRHCLNCGAVLRYKTVLSSHMGHYSCPKCTFTRPNPDIYATDLKFNPDFSVNLKLNVNSQMSTVNCSLPGLYNVYNILASVSVANQLKIKTSEIKKSISNFSAAFGRSEEIEIQGKIAKIFLIKNPTGANEVLRVLALQNNINLFVALNDNLADGRDVSWIWDTNWEVLQNREPRPKGHSSLIFAQDSLLGPQSEGRGPHAIALSTRRGTVYPRDKSRGFFAQNKIKSVTVSGIRALDMATRLKYAGFRLSKNQIFEDLTYSLNFTIKNLGSHESLIILTTYTALLEIKKIISKHHKGLKWHQG